MTLSRTCQVTGARPGFGNRVSHSHRRTKRRFDVNLVWKRYWVPSLRRTVRLRLGTRAIKEIDVRGVEAVVRDLQARGVTV